MTQPAEVTISFTGQALPRVVSASPSVRDLLGYSAEQFLSGEVKWPDLVHPDDQDIVERLWSPMLSSATGSFNIRIRHQDGRIRCILGHYALTPTPRRMAGPNPHCACN